MNQSQNAEWRGVPIASAQVICVLVHGRWQSPKAMEDAVLARLNAKSVAFCLPRAAGGSWYAARAVDVLTDVTRAELGASCDHLDQIVQAARNAAPGVPIVVAGFSQGACLALEWLCSGGSRPDALVALTGCRVGTMTDHSRPAALNGVPVYLTGGDADPWIPVSAFADAVGSLGLAGARLRADMFPGREHEVSAPEIAMLDLVLRELAEGAAVTFGTPR